MSDDGGPMGPGIFEYKLVLRIPNLSVAWLGRSASGAPWHRRGDRSHPAPRDGFPRRARESVLRRAMTRSSAWCMFGPSLGQEREGNGLGVVYLSWRLFFCYFPRAIMFRDIRSICQLWFVDAAGRGVTYTCVDMPPTSPY